MQYPAAKYGSPHLVHGIGAELHDRGVCKAFEDRPQRTFCERLLGSENLFDAPPIDHVPNDIQHHWKGEEK